MKKYQLVILFLIFILINETLPFTYNENYTVRDIKWGWLVAFPFILYLAEKYNRPNESNEDE